MIKFIKHTFLDDSGRPCAKRVTLFAALNAMLLCTGFSIFGYTVAEFVFNSWMWIVIAGAGIVGVEKYLSKK
jgi:hypothetical protein